MTFHLGQQVYVSWAPAPEGAKHAPCSIATIVDGPFPPRMHVPGFVGGIKGVSWIIQPDSGPEVLANEKLLRPFDDPKGEGVRRSREVSV